MALKAELKSVDADSHRSRHRLIATGCFGLCPKGAVALTNAPRLQAGEYVLLSKAGNASEAVKLLRDE